MTCWRRLAAWNEAGVWDQLHLVLLKKLRSAKKLDWSRAVIDSSHVRAARRGPKFSRAKIVGRWDEYDWDQVQKERRDAYEHRLLAWEKANKRLTALGLDPLKSELGGYSAPITLEQITALLDRAEQS
jgi:hypothetical protein